MALDENIQITVKLDATPLDRKAFATPMLLAPASFGDRAKEFGTPQEIKAAESNGDISTTTRDHLLSAFEQGSTIPSSVIHGRREPDQKQIDEITVSSVGSASQNDTAEVDINGTAATYTLGSGPTTNSVASGLETEINNLSEPVTATVSSNVVTVESDTAGLPFDTREGASNDDEIDLSIATTTDNISIKTEAEKVRLANSSWYGFTHQITGSTSSERVTDIERGAEWAESTGKLFLPQTSETATLNNQNSSVGNTLADSNYERTALTYHDTDDAPLAFAWMSAKLSKDQDTGSTQWSYFTVVGITVPGLSEGEESNLEKQNVNYFSNLKGKPQMFPGTTAAGRKLSVRISADWLSARLSERIAGILDEKSNNNEMVAFGDGGISIIENAVERLLDLGERLNHIADGTSETNFPTLSDVTDSDRQAGILRASAGGQPVNPIITTKIDVTMSVNFSGFP